MERAPVETPFTFPGFEDVEAGIVKWPMSVVRMAANLSFYVENCSVSKGSFERGGSFTSFSQSPFSAGQ